MNELLDQTPYSIPDDTHAIDQLAVLIQQEHAIIESARRVRTQLATVARGMSLDSIHRTKEIFESNRIEGIGPDVRRTHEILNTPAADTMADSFDEALFQQSLSKDPDISAVLTLHGARLVANRIRSQIRNGRPLTEVDIRSIHAVICVGEWHAGMYRQFHVKIEKQNHRPPPPDDVPRSMSDLVNWVRTEHDGSTIVKAAVAHAWLTHIHPFEDGNGRLARLLANMILLKGDLPPAIVKSSSQRESYLDALAHSDVGGDILPLAGLFLVTLKKYARELSKPQVATKLFREELARRGNSAYEWWLAEFERFLEILAAELSFHRLTFHRVGSLDIDSFRNLQKLESEGNAWIAIVRDRVGREVLLWWGYPSANMRPPSSEQERFPSVFLSVPAPSWSLHRFHRASAAQTGGLREFAIYPGAPTEVRTLNDETARANRLRRGTVDDSAAEIAERIASGFANNMIPLYSR